MLCVVCEGVGLIRGILVRGTGGGSFAGGCRAVFAMWLEVGIVLIEALGTWIICRVVCRYCAWHCLVRGVE